MLIGKLHLVNARSDFFFCFLTFSLPINKLPFLELFISTCNFIIIRASGCLSLESPKPMKALCFSISSPRAQGNKDHKRKIMRFCFLKIESPPSNMFVYVYKKAEQERGFNTLITGF
jgi:hypothetical protein